MRPIAARLLIGGVAGATATLAIASVLKRFGGHGNHAIGLADLARGAAAGALIATLDERPGRIVGALAGGGLWLAGEIAMPQIAIRPARGDASHAVLLAAHLAWGWTAAQTMRELGAGLKTG